MKFFQLIRRFSHKPKALKIKDKCAVFFDAISVAHEKIDEYEAGFFLMCQTQIKDKADL